MLSYYYILTQNERIETIFETDKQKKKKKRRYLFAGSRASRDNVFRWPAGRTPRASVGRPNATIRIGRNEKRTTIVRLLYVRDAPVKTVL